MPAANPIAIFAPGLNQLRLQWMTVGSIASNAYGQFRATNDVDVILAIERSDASRLSEVFSSDEFYCPPADVIEVEAERAERGHFSLIHHETGI